MMAQRYPTQYSGIVASPPAINWDKFIVSDYCPQFIMNALGMIFISCQLRFTHLLIEKNTTDYYPPVRELNAITKAAIAACDPLDGIGDGLISGPCDFDPREMVGQTVDCNNPIGFVTVSENTAKIVEAA
jgi:hypothetical protein